MFFPGNPPQRRRHHDEEEEENTMALLPPNPPISSTAKQDEQEEEDQSSMEESRPLFQDAEDEEEEEEGIGPSQCSPTLHACFSVLEDTQDLVDLLDQLLNSEGAHVNHLGDWLLFLFACALAKQRPPPLPATTEFEAEKAWCESILSQSAGNRVCPKAFTMGEIVWNCEECQRDSTCVQCAQCFQQSNHEGHNVFFYQVSTSSGGCCDCGDEEAWDPKGFCPHHGSSSSSNALDAQSKPLLLLMFDFITRWMLKSCKVLSRLEGVGTFKFGGGTHSLDKLVEVERACEVQNLEGLEISPADLLSMRLSVLTESCTLICKSSDALVGLLVNSLTHDSVESEELVRELFENEDMELGKLDCRVGNSILEALIAIDPMLPAINSQSFHGCCMRLLSDIKFKQRYGIAYAKTLVQTCEAAKQRVLLDDQITHSPLLYDFGGFLLSIQFLNRPRFVQVLSICFNLMGSILHCLELLMLTEGEDGTLKYSSENPVLRQRVYRYVMNDFKYVLQIDGVSKLFAEQGLLERWMRLLQHVQNCDAERRVEVGHAALNDTDEWIHSAFVMLNLSLIHPYVTSWMISSLTPQLSDMMIGLCSRFVLDDDHVKQLNRDEFSFYLPLYRFVAMCLDFQLNVEHQNFTLAEPVALRLVDSSFKVLALSSMVSLGAWKRNGIGLENINSNYERGAICFFARDLDLKSIQFAMRAVGAEHCVRVAVREFGLAEPSVDYGVGMFLSFFQVMIALVSELPHCTGDFAWELDRLLVHRLSEGSQSLHALGEYLLQWSREVDCTKLLGDDEFLLERLQKISNLRPHSDLQSAVYELKPEMWHQFYDPNYVHQRRERREAAQELWSAERQRWNKQHPRQWLPLSPKPALDCHPMFVECRAELLNVAMPLAHSSLIKCLESEQMASSLALVNVQMVTLCVHCNVELNPELVELLRQCQTTKPFDEVIMDGIRWILAQITTSHTTASAGRAATEAVQGEDDGQETAAAATTPGKLVQDKMDKKRLRAQEKAMKAMRKASNAFGEEFGLTEETTPSVVDQEQYHCTCMEDKDGVIMGFLGFHQTSQTVVDYESEIVTLCGHAMHRECCQKWKSTSVAHALQALVEDRSRGEFLCPLCKAVCNAWIPFDKQLAQCVFPLATVDAVASDEQVPLQFHELGEFEPFRARRDQENEEGEQGDFLREFRGSCARYWQGTVISLFCNPLEAKSKVKSLLLTCVSLGLNPATGGVDAESVDMTVPEVRFGIEFLNSLCRNGGGRNLEFERQLFVYCLGMKLAQLMEGGLPVDAAIASGGGGGGEEENDEFFLSLGVRNLVEAKRDLAQFINLCQAITLQSLPMSLQVRQALDNAEFRDFSSRQRVGSLHAFRIRALTALPADYTTLLLNANLDQPCPICREVAAHERAVCLLCGEVATTGSNCYRNSVGEGACTAHANQHHGGVCAFFLVQRSVVLFVNRKKSVLYSSLYLDKHGEDRNGHNRGLPMKLDPMRMANVQSIFEQHRIPMEIASRSSKTGFVHDNYF
ncbi:hypothetical protein BASA81_000447 [Batrachochytrium salamandrivorans]|nr:hypothetical protein BASA81_000447 [Batrachochytrium salamandrivorans]